MVLIRHEFNTNPTLIQHQRHQSDTNGTLAVGGPHNSIYEDADLPRIRLPSFTLVFALGDEDDVVEKLLNRAMGILVSITNVQRIQSKQTRIDVRTGGRDDYRFKYVRFGDWNASGDPPLEQGLSPTLLFAHGHGILASTIDGAVRMAETLKSGKTP